MGSGSLKLDGHDRHGNAVGQCHIVEMADQSPPPYDLIIRPCMIQAGRYRWDIRRDGTPVQSSIQSFSSEQEARMDGRRELERLIQISSVEH